MCQTSSTVCSTCSPLHVWKPCFFCRLSNSLKFIADDLRDPAVDFDHFRWNTSIHWTLQSLSSSMFYVIAFCKSKFTYILKDTRSHLIVHSSTGTIRGTIFMTLFCVISETQIISLLVTGWKAWNTKKISKHQTAIQYKYESYVYDTIEEFNTDSKAECGQLNLAHSPNFSHITPILRSLYWRKINERNTVGLCQQIIHGV